MKNNISSPVLGRMRMALEVEGKNSHQNLNLNKVWIPNRVTPWGLGFRCCRTSASKTSYRNTSIKEAVVFKCS